MTALLATLGFILVLVGSATAMLVTALGKKPPVDFVGYCLLGGAACYTLVWLGGNGALFFPIFFVILALAWWYGSAWVLSEDQPKERNPWD